MNKKIKTQEYTNWDKNIAKPNKINRAVYIVRLKHSLKKASMTELNITLACVSQEIAKRQKGNKK